MDASLRRGSSSLTTFSPNYILGKTIGHGSFGEVKIAVHTLTGLKVAVKILNRQEMKRKKMEEEATREMKILRLLSHPHVIRLYEVIETPTEIYVVMEFVDSGDLFEYILENGRLQEDKARYFFQQIISGLEYCHDNLVAHRDLKPENLLLDSKHKVKIADFGLSNVMRDGHFLKKTCGSPNYAAPEILSRQWYAGPEVDVWSCGVVLYALLCAVLPFDEGEISDLYRKIKNGIYSTPRHLSHGARDIISRMLVVDPIKRITIPEIQQHPWFQAHLPRYLAVPQPDTSKQDQQIDERIIQQMVNAGFERDHLIESLRNSTQNNVTVAYYLLLDNQLHVSNSSLETEVQQTMESGFNHMHQSESPYAPAVRCLPRYMGFQRIGLASPSLGNRKWALGLQSRGNPREIMAVVLKAMQELAVSWKKIGHYNVKCRWVPATSGHQGAMQHHNPFVGNEPETLQNDGAATSSNVVKFEMQLFKTYEEKYLLDLQRVQGPQFLFLDLCAAFLTQLRVV